MLTTKLKKTTFLFATALLTMLVACQSPQKDNGFTTVSTTMAGTLASKLSGSQWGKITKLKISGPLNNNDISFIKSLDNNGLQSLDLSEAKGIDTIGMFFCFSKFRSIVLPNTVSDIDGSAFQGCNNLGEIKLNTNNPNFKIIDGALYTADTTVLIAYPPMLKNERLSMPSAVCGLGNAATLANCIYLKEIVVSEGDSLLESCNGVLYTKGKENLIAYPAGKTDTSYTLPAITTTVNWSAFWGCRHLREINTEPDNAYYTSAGGSLVQIVSNGNKSINVLAAYPAGRKVSEYTIPGGIERIEALAFCHSPLKKVNIGKDVDDIDQWAFLFSDVEQIDIEKENEYYHSENGLIFSGKDLYLCTQNKTGKADIPETLTIGARSFQRCEKLTELTIEPTLAIGPFAFSYCSQLKKVTLKEGIEKIDGENAFFCCNRLQEVYLPFSLKEIAPGCFFGCFSLNKIRIVATVPPSADTDIFEGVDFENCTLEVPAASVSSYKSSQEWSKFKHITGI